MARPHVHLDHRAIVGLLAEHGQDMLYRFRLRPEPYAEYVSPAAAKLTGYHPEDFYSDPALPLKVVHPDDRPAAVHIAKAPEDFSNGIVLRWVHPDGGIVHVEHRVVPIRDRDGTLVGIEGIGRNVTERARVEEQLRASQAQLRQLAGRLVAAREEERTLVARELHDHLGQILTTFRLDLARIRQHLPAECPGGVLEDLDEVMKMAESAGQAVRQLTTGLRPPVLDALGLIPAIELETASIARRTGLRFRISERNAPRDLDPAVATALFRIFQEALTNVVRHARASTVRIGFRAAKDRAVLSIQDNGRGITGEELRRADAIGLLGMRERAEMLAGRLFITGKPGRGTRVTISLPFRGPRGRTIR